MQRVSEKLQQRRDELVHTYNMCVATIGITLSVVLLIIVLMLVLT